MKKLISLLLIAVVSFLFCGCTETNSNIVVKETGSYEESSTEEKEQNKEQKFGLNETAVFDEGTLDGSIQHGKKLVGWYALEVPQDWTNIELDVQADWLSNNSAKFFFEK